MSDVSAERLEIALDAPDYPAVKPFWQALLGYDAHPKHEDDLRDGLLRILSVAPESAALEDHLLRMKQVIDQFQPERVAIDSLTALHRVATVKTFREYVLGLTFHIKQRADLGLVTTTLALGDRVGLVPAAAGIWAGLLRLKRVGIHENVFELGGDSILTIQVIARARQRGLMVEAILWTRAG